MNISFANKKKNVVTFLLFTAFSFGLLYFCTASSPRYAINLWNDANAFFTVGKAMANGLTVYKDIFEQKGPLLYLIHAVASLISDTSFYGVYDMQAVSLAVTAFAAYKIASLYIDTGWSVTCAVLVCFVTVNSQIYYYGDSAEEFCLPLLMISLYYFCLYFKNTEQSQIKKSTFLLIGFFAGCVSMIKFTVIGFWFAWAAYISLYTLIAKKDFKSAVKNAMIFLIGMASAIVPWLIYFAAKGALHDFINTYFVINSTAYSANEKVGIIQKLWRPVYLILNLFNIFATRSPILVILALSGIALFAFTDIFSEKRFFSRLSVPFVCGVGIYIIYFGLRDYGYYLLPFSAFTVFTFIAICSLFQKLIKGKSKAKASYAICAVFAATAIISSAFINISSQDAPLRGEKTVQSEAAAYIESHNPDGKILNYRCLDIGVYLAADQIPSFKHFELQNIIYDKYKENIDEQNRYINENLADYVVTRIPVSTTVEDIYRFNPTLETDYKIVYTGEYSLRSTESRKEILTAELCLFELKEK